MVVWVVWRQLRMVRMVVGIIGDAARYIDSGKNSLGPEPRSWGRSDGG